MVQALVAALNRGDWDAVFKDAAPGFEWDNTRAMNPDTRGVFTVDEALRVFKPARQIFESLWIEINEVVDVGDHVLVPHTFHARGREGVEAQARSTWLFTIRNGMIEHGCLYQDTQDALKAVGLSE